MSLNKEIKKQICAHLQRILDEKAEVAIRAIESAKESRNSDTKSSAGDKYETGRAMMQIEIEKNEVQLSKINSQLNELSRVNHLIDYKKVEYGSLIETNRGIYFIAIGLGKIEVNKQEYYSISLASPIGQLLKDKHIEDDVEFQGREYIIRDII